MGYLPLWLGAAVFFVSVFGLALFNFYKLKIEAAFSFVVAVCEIVTALFAVGCLNLLSVGYYLLAVFSTVCFFYYILRIIMKRERADFFISPAVLFIAAASVLSVVLYHDVISSVPDEVTHWQLVVKEILCFDSFPDLRSIVQYRNYPPSTALFLYYALKATGFSEGFAHVYQAIFAFSALATLFVGTSYKKPVRLIASLFIAAVTSSVCAVAYTGLHVDYLLAFFGAALFVMTVWYFKDGVPKGTVSLWAISFVSVSLTLIKTSGLLFSLMGLFLIAILACCIRRENKQKLIPKEKKGLFGATAILLSPVYAYLLWRAYIEKGYLGNGYASSKFAVSSETIAAQYINKSEKILSEMPSLFVKTLLSSKLTLAFFFALVIAVTFIIIIYVKRKKVSSLLVCSSITAVGLWGAYNVGYYFMLRYLMPAWEMGDSAKIIDYVRYEESVVGAVVALLLFATVVSVKKYDILETTVKKAIAVAVAVLLFVPVLNINNFKLDRQSTWYREFLQIDAVYEQIPVSLRETLRHNPSVMFYISDVEPKGSSSFNCYDFSTKYQNDKVTCFSNDKINSAKVDNISYSPDDDNFITVLGEHNYIVIAIESKKLFETLDLYGVGYDATDGVLYEITSGSGGYSLIKKA